MTNESKPTDVLFNFSVRKVDEAGNTHINELILHIPYEEMLKVGDTLYKVLTDNGVDCFVESKETTIAAPLRVESNDTVKVEAPEGLKVEMKVMPDDAGTEDTKE
jgi:hypothetical protein